MRHDTPSIDRWWIVNSSRPACSGPASNHTACSITPAAGASSCSAACAARSMQARRACVIQTTHIDPPQARRSIHAARRRDLKRSVRVACPRHNTQPQRIVVIKHALQSSNQVPLLQAGRHPQQHRLMEAIDRPAALQQPMHDRRRRQATDRNVGQHGGCLLDGARSISQRRHRLMLEYRAGGDDEPGTACPAHQLDRHDAVAAQLKEVVVDPDPLNPQHLRKQRAQDLLLRRARPPPQPGRRQINSRQRTAVQLAVRRQRQTIQHHKRRRHHVVRQAGATARARSDATSSAAPDAATT